MPELPEVERARKLLEATVVDRVLERVRCERDDIVLEGRRPRAVQRALEGRRVLAARRWGKYLWLELDGPGPGVVFHLGMTGGFRRPGDEPLPLASSPREPDRGWPPRFTKARLWTADGEVAFTNARRLGRVLLRSDPRTEPPIARLGFDPHLAMPALGAFRALLAGRRTVLKGLLLDQGFAAGVGNWIADEVLYHARLDPRRSVDQLSDREIAALHRALRHVIRTAVRVDADKTRFPRGWLFHHRWGRDAEATTARGERVEHLTLAGRTTAWVPSRQR